MKKKIVVVKMCDGEPDNEFARLVTETTLRLEWLPNQDSATKVKEVVSAVVCRLLCAELADSEQQGHRN